MMGRFLAIAETHHGKPFCLEMCVCVLENGGM